MLVIDARRIRDPKDADEALGVDRLYAEPGESILFHRPMCLLNVGGQCTCTPRVLVVPIGAPS